ncbi:guanylate kinase [Aeromonas veronii]|uniref:guanylate kinase n=1 Tax=Aeromonas TaxID=642 RepID=UPI00084B7CE3|nr:MULTISPECIES: guanylate kinase [Aeromonas]MCF5765163.1 guanylate kinase [Aeromonas veronii]OEC51512.1 guanylate kinase [Aeromonas sp. ANNP30]OEC63125.1 guanylate kinase [Aeromonas sp. ANP5]
MAQQGTLYIISSPSGAGKSSLLNALLTNHNQAGKMQLSVSHTTRATRPGEVHGVHYHFVQVEEFKALIERGDFLEWAEVFGNYYGTSRAAIEACLAKGIDVFLDIDWQGARQIREQMPTKSIFILPPSREELERRLIGRGQDSAEVIAGRMAKAIAEMVHYDEYDYVIINEDFEQALFQLRSIIECQRLEMRQQQQAQQNLLQQLLAE